MWLISEESRVNHGKHRLERTESMVSGEAELLAADAQGLSIDEPVDLQDNQNNGNEAAIEDIEDAAQDAEIEMEEDDTAAEMTDDDRGSTIASDIDRGHVNPLQSGKAGHGEDENSESEDSLSESDRDESAESGADPQIDNATSNPAGSPQSKQNQVTPQKQNRPKRGANTKAKRAAKQKYALQSDEERELALSLLGSTKGQQKREDEAVARAAREQKSQADKERRRAQHQRAAEVERKRMEALERGEAVDDIAEQEIDAEQLEQERKELLDIDLLVPYPEPGDELVTAIPVVAPWMAMARYKYKVKLQPGSLKKGKMVKEILGNWAALATKGPRVIDENNRDKEKVWAREIECLKGWKAEEVVGAVPVKGVRIVQAGGFRSGSSAGGGAKGRGNPARGGKGGKKR